MATRPIPELSEKHKTKFWSRVNKNGSVQTHCRKLGACWEWTDATCKGRAVFNIKAEHFYSSRISWWMHFGQIPPGQQVLHKCDNPLCVNPDHLFLGTQAENMRDMIKKGRNVAVIKPGYAPRGMKSGNAKLTDAIVLEIRALCTTQNCAAVGRILGINRHQVWSVHRRKSWSHLP